LETRGPDHAREIFDALNRSGYEFRQIHSDPVIR
jgi:hypothetical protein